MAPDHVDALGDGQRVTFCDPGWSHRAGGTSRDMVLATGRRHDTRSIFAGVDRVATASLQPRVSGMAESRGEPVLRREPDVTRGRDHRPGNSAGSFGPLIRSPKTLAGAPPKVSKQSAIIAAFSSLATRTNRTRDQAGTVPNTLDPDGSSPSRSPAHRPASIRPALAVPTIRFANQIEHHPSDSVGVPRHRRSGAFIIQRPSVLGEQLPLTVFGPTPNTA